MREAVPGAVGSPHGPAGEAYVDRLMDGLLAVESLHTPAASSSGCACVPVVGSEDTHTTDIFETASHSFITMLLSHFPSGPYICVDPI